jgi:hypothetical protein
MTGIKWDERVYQVKEKFLADEFIIAYQDIYTEIYVFDDQVVLMEKSDHSFSVERSEHAIKHYTHLPLEEDLTQGNRYSVFSINTSNIDLSEKENMYYMKEYVE